MSILQRCLSLVVDVRREEARPLLLMFLYSFLIMTSYNIVKPLTRAQFIDELGADNLPWVLLVSGLVAGLVMQLYAHGVARLPSRAVLATSQLAIAVMLFAFWPLFRFGVPGTSVAFYLLGQILGLLLISQFWTLANDIYNARQAKRVFGFIGGGASFGGITGSAIVAFAVEQLGLNNLLLVSGAILVVCTLVVTTILRLARGVSVTGLAGPAEGGAGGLEALQLLRASRHVQLIALLMSFAAIGAGLLDQQLNMAVELAEGDEGAAGIASFLGRVQLYLSIIGFVIQVWLTSRVHRYLGIGFAMLVLPIGLGVTAGLILATGAIWAAVTGRIVDSSLRYTVDKTTREVLFLPLPNETKYRTKAVIDVTVDRFARGIGAAVTLVLIQPWGLNLAWHQLSWVSLVITVAWIACAIAARRQYLASLRQSIARRGVESGEIRIATADLSTIEMLVEELAQPDEDRVLYAIDLLESLDKRNLVTPLLLHHASPRVRVRALEVLGTAQVNAAGVTVVVEQLVDDPHPEVRSAAVRALANLRDEDAAEIARAMLDDANPGSIVTAAVVLSGSDDPDDQRTARRALAQLAFDPNASDSTVRRDLAAAIRQVGVPEAYDLLVPLLEDSDADVAEEAMRSVRMIDTESSGLFVPSLVSLLGDRRLKSAARATLARYGESVVDVLEHFLVDPGEDPWVRRHIPATLARIPCERSMDVLAAALTTDDGFLRFKVLEAIEKLRRDHPSLRLRSGRLEQLVTVEARAYFTRLGQHHTLFGRGGLDDTTALARALDEKLERSVDRIYRLLGLLQARNDVVAARLAIERGDSRARADAIEHLDNVLSGQLRRHVIPVLEDTPVAEKVRAGYAILNSHLRDVDETLLDLINDQDQVVAAAAIDLVGTHRLWGLRDDVEHVLSHRDANDWFVFEAASWTLAAYLLSPEQRRERWREPLPATVVVDRMRALPLFSSVWIDELFRLAGTGRQTRHQPGAVLFRTGAKPRQLHVLLDGEVALSDRTDRTTVRRLEAPAALGFEQALEGSRMRETIRTTGPAVTLEIATEELSTLLADSADLVEGLFRTLVERQRLHRGFIRIALPPDLTGLDQLTAAQKSAALRRIPLFARLGGIEMLHLAEISELVQIKTGSAVTDETSPSCFAVVLEGELQLFDDGRSQTDAVRVTPGDVVGLYEALAGIDIYPEQMRLLATTPCSILRVERSDLFDLLGHQPDLLQQMFSVALGGTRRRAEPRATSGEFGVSRITD